MTPYKLKHTPTGLYFQPHKHRGSNLSKNGKIYQTGTHGLSSALKYATKYPDDEKFKLFDILVQKDSVLHKKLIDKFDWIECKYSHGQLRAYTKLVDWVKEPIK